MELASCICPAPDGGYLLGGTSSSDCSGDKTGCLKGVIDYWVIRVDEDGNKLWDRTYGGDTFDELATIRATNDGGYLLGGKSTSGVSGDKSEPSFGEFDFWVVKIDAAGNVQWDRTYGGTGNEDLVALAQAAGGGYLIAGTSDSDSRVVKTDARGNVEWNHVYGGQGKDILKTLTPVEDGGFLLGGYTDSKARSGRGSRSEGDFDYWIIRVDSAGNTIWERNLGGSSNDFLTCMSSTGDGGFLAGGYSCSESSSYKHDGSFGGYDFWVVCLNGRGEILWETTLGGSLDENLICIQEDDDGGYILMGNAGAKSQVKYSPCAHNWMIKIDRKGNRVWETKIGMATTKYAQFTKMIPASDEGFLLLGHAEGDSNTTDFFLSKVDPGSELIAGSGK